VQRTGKQHAATRRKEEDKSRLLAFVAEGLSIAEGLRQLGRPIRTYEEWRRTDTEWASRITTARLRRADKDLPGMEFVQFRSVFFGHETAPHHYRMIEAVERAEPDTITMILAFPEAAKTALMTDRVNHVLGSVNPNYRFCVISEGQDLARKIVGHVASRMTDEMQYGAYIKAYGPFRSPDRTRSNKPWNADYLQILGAANDEKEPSLEARGWGSKLYGGRYDEIILDDMQSSESLNQTPQMLRYLRQTVLTRPAKGVGKTIYVGSRVGVGDLPDVMVDEGMIDRLVTIPVAGPRRPLLRRQAEQGAPRPRLPGTGDVELLVDAAAGDAAPQGGRGDLGAHLHAAPARGCRRFVHRGDDREGQGPGQGARPDGAGHRAADVDRPGTGHWHRRVRHVRLLVEQADDARPAAA
jgi:hypothetical protein